MRTRWPLLLLVVLALVVNATACGGDDQAAEGDRPSPLPDDEAAIPVAELLADRPTGEVVVRAVAFDDGQGLVLCEALAESFPPQCPGESVPVVNPDHLDEVEFTSSGAVRWTDRPLTVVGTLTEDGFDIQLLSRSDG